MFNLFFWGVWGRFGGRLGDFFGDIWGVFGSIFEIFWRGLGVKNRGKPGGQNGLEILLLNV